MVRKIIINGAPIVKKNNQRLVTVPGRRSSTGKPYKRRINTKSYNGWHESALRQLQGMGYDPEFANINKQLKEYGQPQRPALINEQVNLCCRFYMPTDGRCDLSALYEGIQDVLVEVGILDDDNWHIVASHDGSGVEKDAARPRMEITITPKSEMYER